jgi:hypothetical protein
LVPRRKYAPDVSTLHYRENRRRLQEGGGLFAKNLPFCGFFEPKSIFLKKKKADGRERTFRSGKPML